MKFDRPAEVVIFCRVTVRPGPVDAQTLIPETIEKWVAGESEGEEGLTIGREVSPFEIAAVVNQADPRLFVAKVELSKDGLTWSMDTIPVHINEIARLNRGAVQVVII